MKKSMLLAGAALLLTAVASPARAQSTIAPGMTAEQVRGRFGPPATTRVAGEWVYWYYHNGCPVRCGSDDVVFFQNERVVAAVLRTARRRFAGPAADDALEQAGGGVGNGRMNDAPPADGRARVGGVRVEEQPGSVIVVPGPANDATSRPQAREGRPGEPSTIVIGAPAQGADAPVNAAREGRPGEPATMVITTPPGQDIAPTIEVAAPRPGETVVRATNETPFTPAGTNPPDVDGPLPVTAPAQLDNASQLRPEENTDAADTRGETSVDRKNRRNQQDRRNEPTATERARRNDARNP
jgi:hypothetical protein